MLTPGSHRRLGVRFEDELVMVKVDDLLLDGEVRQRDDLAE